MPFVRITVLAPELRSDQIGYLQQHTKELMAAIMRKPVGGIAVLVEHVKTGSWRIAGKDVSVAAHVEALIGRGTNTAAEKARFMEQIMTALGKVLGPALAEETYVVFHEANHDSYGRGGLSRAERDERQADQKPRLEPRPTVVS